MFSALLIALSLPLAAESTAESAYRRALEDRTRTATFEAGAGYNPYVAAQGVQAAAEVYQMYQWNDFYNNYADLTGGSTGLYNAQMALGIGSLLARGVAAHQQRQQAARQYPKVEITAVYWDDRLRDLQRAYLAERDGVPQRDIQPDPGVVFELRVRNIGYQPIGLSNLRGQLFLMSPDGYPISPQSVDYNLGQTLHPGQVVIGKVSFGSAAVGDRVTLAFEGVLGQREEMSFRSR